VDKLSILIAVIIVGGIVDAVWPGFFPALWWLLVLAAAVGLGIFCINGLQGLSAAKAEARRQRRELEALHRKVVREHERIWEEAHELDRIVTEHQRALDQELSAAVGCRGLGSEAS
jgi:hypothetical protein